MNLLKEEVERQRGNGKKLSSYVQTELNLKLDARIPIEFIDSESDRLKLYRDLFKLRSIDALAELEANTGDRYGKLPLSFRKLFILAKVKILASDLGLQSIRNKWMFLIPYQRSYF